MITHNGHRSLRMKVPFNNNNNNNNNKNYILYDALIITSKFSKYL